MVAQTVALANCCRIFCSESAARSGVSGLAASDAWGRAFLGVWYAIWLVRRAGAQLGRNLASSAAAGARGPRRPGATFAVPDLAILERQVAVDGLVSILS